MDSHGSKIPQRNPPKTKIQIPSSLKIKENVPLARLQKIGMGRRSKSFSDLPKTVLSQFPPRPVQRADVRTAVDRKRPGTAKTEGAPVVKKKKIPDWDYKSRFLELQDKYQHVVSEHKVLQAKQEDFKHMEPEYNRLKKWKIETLVELDSLHKENTEFSTKIDCLTSESQGLREEVGAYKIEKAELVEELTKIKKSLKDYQAKNFTILSDYNRAQGELKKLTEMCNVLKSEVCQHEDQRRIMHNTIQDLKGNIRVFCRVRPPTTSEEKDKLQCAIFYPDEATLEIRKSRESHTVTGRPAEFKHDFHFDKVFPTSSQQDEIFEELGLLVQSALDGYQVCVFAYGQTGSGKTYTMEGTPDNPGMIPKTVSLVFQRIEELKKSGWTYTASTSFLEIYNETVKDLLQLNQGLSHELRYNEGRGVTVTNLKTQSISSSQELHKLMKTAMKNRAVAATDINEHSSRSHFIAKITLEGVNEEHNVTYTGSIHLVDLAGSERAKTNSGDRLVESKNINKSLAELGLVMMALKNKENHVPYRNSKLTYLLQSCLGGNSKTLMFVNIAPFEDCYAESINSLRFASKVKEVKTSVKKVKSIL